MAVVDPPLGFSATPSAEPQSPETLTGSRLIIAADATAVGPPTTPTTSWVHDAEIDIKDLLSLDEGWDGDAADPISIAAVENAIRLANVFNQADLATQLPRPRVLPTINGGVAISWSSPTARVEFEIDDAGDIRVMAVSPDGDIDTTDAGQAEAAFMMLRHFIRPT